MPVTLRQLQITKDTYKNHVYTTYTYARESLATMVAKPLTEYCSPREN